MVSNESTSKSQRPMGVEKFYKLFVKITKRKDLTSSAKIVWAIITDHIGVNSYSWPGISTLMREAGLARQTVLDAIQSLEDVGLLDVLRRGIGKSNHYKTSLETRPVQKLDQSKNQTGGSLETRPEPVQKLDCNQTDQLNQIKGEEVFSPKAYVEYWNSKVNLPQMKSFTDHRQKKLKVRMREKFFTDNWREIIDKISASSFCTGGSERGWRADIDWVLKNSSNYAKVFEGNYDNHQVSDRTASGGNGQDKERPLTPELENEILDQFCSRNPTPEEERLIEQAYQQGAAS